MKGLVVEKVFEQNLADQSLFVQMELYRLKCTMKFSTFATNNSPVVNFSERYWNLNKVEL